EFLGRIQAGLSDDYFDHHLARNDVERVDDLLNSPHIVRCSGNYKCIAVDVGYYPNVLAQCEQVDISAGRPAAELRSHHLLTAETTAAAKKELAPSNLVLLGGAVGHESGVCHCAMQAGLVHRSA